MVVLLTIIAWCIQLGALLFLPALLYFCLRSFTKRNTARLAALLCVTAVFISAAWVAHHPFRSCPEELEPYMSETRWQDILSVTGPIYSRHLPFFPWKITVERADEEELYWRVDWFPAGTTRTGVTPDGYDPVHSFR